MDLLRTIGGLAGAFLVTGTIGWGSFLVAVRLCQGGSSSTRMAAAVVLAGSLLVAGFETLTAVGAFRVDVVVGLGLLGLAALLATPGRQQEARRLLRADLANALVAAGKDDAWVRIAAATTGTLAAARLFRGLAAPPLAYDALTYHLARAATWVQTGAQDRFIAPDAWGYCTFYPAAGDALWAWAMLATHDDLLLAPAGALLWLAAVLGTYAGSRALGAARRAASLAALALGAAPCVLPHLAASYVDLPALAWLLNGFALAAVHARSGRRAPAVLAAASLSLAAATRSSALPWLVLGLATIAVVEARRQSPAGERARTIAACLAAALLAAPTYLGTWADTGSPFYPLAVRILDIPVFPGNDEFLWVHSGAAFGLERLPPLQIAAALFVPDPTAESPHLNLGPVAPLLLLLGTLGAARLLRRGPRAPAALALAIAAAVASGTFLWEGSAGFLAVPFWLDKVGRFLMPGLALALVLGAVVSSPLANAVRIAAIATGLWLSFPQGWSAPDTAATARIAAVLVPALLVGLASARALAGHGRPCLAGGFAILVLLAAMSAVPMFRADARYPTWAAASRGDAFDLHPANRRSLEAWPIWEALDGLEGTRIALAAGFDGVGHNWYTYPLFGSRLQNRVTYVPVTSDGQVLDYARGDLVQALADRNTWLARLAAEDIEVLVTLWPDPPETAWADALPDVFKPWGSTPGGRSFRVDQEALGRMRPEPANLDRLPGT